ncbi:MAG: hypothetical protein GTO46_10395 [Gemmatimonadetes bacterium]|nr:hypothetical protein [Gemmatimonadota bacterium]NIO32022.1 hypothetical protein [Gemmatimonadota bacterium]
MAGQKSKAEQKRLRELARQTLEAYRELNAAAAETAFVRSNGPNGESMARAGELLESVIAELRGTAKLPG